MGWFLVCVLCIIIIKLIIDDVISSKKAAEGKKIIEKEREKTVDLYYNSSKYFKEGYVTRQNITNDFFLSSNYSSYTISDRYTDTEILYCRFANTANCVNCSRRYEHYIDGLYYYGVSSNCKKTIETDKD